MADFSRELTCRGLVAGVDEVGRGPLAGPVMAAALVFTSPPGAEWLGVIDDSKKLTAGRRIRAFEKLSASDDVCFAVAGASVREVDALNIRGATHLAMRRAFAGVRAKLGARGLKVDCALVDGHETPGLGCTDERSIIKGDGKSLSIAGASIVAKVVRDRLMGRLDGRYPAYGWAQNMGYPTKAHKSGLARTGVSPHHRTSFSGVRSAQSGHKAA